MNKRLQVFKYVITDYLAALIAWAFFFTYRKITIDLNSNNLQEQIFIDNNLYLGLLIIPTFWMILYAITGTYKKIFRKSRLGEMGQTLLIVLIGVIIIFFTILLDDDVKSYKSYYNSFLFLFFLHFGLTFTGRLILTSITAYKIRKRIYGFPTIILGSQENALAIYNEINGQKKGVGNKFVGFVHVKNYTEHLLSKHLHHLGFYKDIKQIITDYKIEEVIIAIEPSEHKNIGKIITEIEELDIIIKIIPDMHDILLGRVKMTSIFDAPLIKVSPDLMPSWQLSIKRLIDVFVSIICLIVLSPLYLITAIIVKSTSKGPIFYSHERIGIHGKPFLMHKFRSMTTDAEKNGPQLSSKSDSRITPFGKFMRKVRLDEIPQFYNVLIGDMSLVGPRPERQFFIDQIVKIAPHYRLLHKVKPGITSWGQVKFGYAENVDEMIVRLKYDVLYIENMSLAVDFKILIYTILIVIQGRGK